MALRRRLVLSTLPAVLLRLRVVLQMLLVLLVLVVLVALGRVLVLLSFHGHGPRLRWYLASFLFSGSSKSPGDRFLNHPNIR